MIRPLAVWFIAEQLQNSPFLVFIEYSADFGNQSTLLTLEPFSPVLKTPRVYMNMNYCRKMLTQPYCERIE